MRQTPLDDATQRACGNLDRTEKTREDRTRPAYVGQAASPPHAAVESGTAAAAGLGLLVILTLLRGTGGQGRNVPSIGRATPLRVRLAVEAQAGSRRDQPRVGS